MKVPSGGMSSSNLFALRDSLTLLGILKWLNPVLQDQIEATITGNQSGNREKSFSGVSAVSGGECGLIEKCSKIVSAVSPERERSQAVDFKNVPSEERAREEG